MGESRWYLTRLRQVLSVVRSEKREARKSCRRRLCEGHADMRGSADLLSDHGVVVRRLDLETAVVGPEVD